MSGAAVHPIAMFHVPLDAAGVSIGDLFALGGALPEPGAVTLLGYDWEYAKPLREGVAYVGGGGVGAVQRSKSVDGVVQFDDVDFVFSLSDESSAVVATATHHWRFRRATAPHAVEAFAADGGTPLPPFEVVADGARMKTMAALLRDPYPIHWDPEASRAAGHDGRAVNQGPLNVGYVANMLMAWAGDECVRRLSVRFHGRVFDGDRLEAGGVHLESGVSNVAVSHGAVGECVVWLDRIEPDGTRTRVLSGTATITR